MVIFLTILLIINAGYNFNLLRYSSDELDGMKENYVITTFSMVCGNDEIFSSNCSFF